MPEKITLVIVSCKRLDLLKITIETFFQNCLDIDLIGSIILIDDNSDSTGFLEIIQIIKKYNIPTFFIHKFEHKGQVTSLNTVWDIIRTNYLFMLEDDWKCLIKDNFIRKAFQVMAENPDIKEFQFRINPEIMAVGQIRQKTKDGSIEFIKYNYDGAHAKDKQNRSSWPGFNLNPGLWNFAEIKTLGKFNHEKCNFEYEYSRRFWKIGWKVGYFPSNVFEHIGMEVSAYTLNGTKR